MVMLVILDTLSITVNFSSPLKQGEHFQTSKIKQT